MTSGSEALEILDPTPERHGGPPTKTAPRLDSLQGKTVGLLWNGKPMGDVALRHAAELISREVPDVRFTFYSGSMPCSPALLATLVEECDAAIACTADCGSCTSWITHDCVQVERKGIPTVIIASKGFEHDVETSSRAFAMPDPFYVTVPLVYNNLEADATVEQTTPVVGEIIAKLTTGATVERVTDPGQRHVSWRYSGADAFDQLAEFNRDFLSRDWGDGYPLLPPTRARVDALVDGVDGAADDVVCLLPPGNGEATVEKVAVNAAMAGCVPEEMPVVMAALRAIAGMRPVPRGALMSTSAHAPLFVVNGPLGRRLGINGARACLGPGRQNEVNLRIGRAVVLALKNLGSWYPGVMDLDSVGTPRKNIVVVAENEAESPWEPYHVSQGYALDDDTITLFFTSGEWDISIQGHLSGHQLAAAVASFSGGNNSGGYFTNLGGTAEFSGLGRLLFMPPPHALPIAGAGFTKQGLEKFMYHQGREPISRLIEPVRKLHADGKIKPEWEWVFALSDDEARRQTLPVIERPDQYSIVVVGSVRAKDLLMPTRTMPFTERITASPAPSPA